MRIFTTFSIFAFFFIIFLASVSRFSVNNANIGDERAQFNSIDIRSISLIDSNNASQNQYKDKDQNQSKNIFSLDEISTHNTASDCYLIINNNVYDVTDYINKHPGGSFAIIDNCGKESTGLFARIHSNKAWDLLKNFKVGIVDDKELKIQKTISIEFEKRNPGAKVLSARKNDNGYLLKVTRNNSLYEIQLDLDGKVINTIFISKKTPKYLWEADERNILWEEFEEIFESGFKFYDDEDDHDYYEYYEEYE